MAEKAKKMAHQIIDSQMFDRLIIFMTAFRTHINDSSLFSWFFFSLSLHNLSAIEKMLFSRASVIIQGLTLTLSRAK